MTNSFIIFWVIKKDSLGPLYRVSYSKKMIFDGFDSNGPSITFMLYNQIDEPVKYDFSFQYHFENLFMLDKN